ncbi:protein RoBo-1-like [Mercenaria mercenaria]|uniref:protein RoBo-1-like n=1 Tax=Mercenaria mercenaria TaxID=6596 RepID=UPI00234F1FEF|nr:protein RoBo-1-like [Mercenaria mercenaria]
MDGLNLVFLLVCFISVAFAYECVEKACRSGRCISETTCTANATNGCVIYRSSGVVVHNCSSVPCVPIWSSTNGNESTADCCFSDRCNSDSMASNTVDDPAVDECYSITCNTVGCLNKSINEGKARLCPVFPNRKCMTTKVNERRTTTCSQLSCQAVQTESVIIECCTGNLCNTPTEDMFKTTAAPATTTKKDTSGAGRLGHLRYIIYTLFTFLVSIIS